MEFDYNILQDITAPIEPHHEKTSLRRFDSMKDSNRPAQLFRVTTTGIILKKDAHAVLRLCSSHFDMNTF